MVVVGSINADWVYSVERHPGPGETVSALGFAVHPGGKGLNQAVGARRAGVPTTLVAGVGADEYADLLLATLTNAPLRRSRRAVRSPQRWRRWRFDERPDTRRSPQAGDRGRARRHLAAVAARVRQFLRPDRRRPSTLPEPGLLLVNRTAFGSLQAGYAAFIAIAMSVLGGAFLIFSIIRRNVDEGDS